MESEIICPYVKACRVEVKNDFIKFDFYVIPKENSRKFMAWLNDLLVGNGHTDMLISIKGSKKYYDILNSLVWTRDDIEEYFKQHKLIPTEMFVG